MESLICEISKNVSNNSTYNLCFYEKGNLVKKSSFLKDEDLAGQIFNFLRNSGEDYELSLKIQQDCGIHNATKKSVENMFLIHNKSLDTISRGFATQNLD